jgi:stage II sporulation protein D
VSLPILAALFAQTAIAAGAAPLDESEEIRILLQVGRGPLRIGAERLTLVPNEGETTSLEGAQASLACVQGQVVAAGKKYVGPVAIAAEGPLEVLGRRLRGQIEVSCAGQLWTAINVLPMETYLTAVLGGEMPPGFPPEALKAQAVAARSYALMRKIDARDQGKPYHLSATVLSQVYAGLSREDPRTATAVEATRGEVLAQGVTPVEAYFHASCGGKTETGSAALGRPLDYLKSVSCPCQARSPYAHWRVEVAAEELAKAVGLTSVADAEVASRTSGGRASKLRVKSEHGEERTPSAIQVRASLGYQRLPSTWFDLHKEGGRFVFEGRGSGHGAGLCQWGARLLAEEGQGYREILAHYYPGTEVEKIY